MAMWWTGGKKHMRITPRIEFTVNELIKGIPVKALKNGKLDEKFVEIVVRQADGKISGIVKCALDSGEGQKMVSSILSKVPAMGGIGTISSLANNVQTEMVRREVKNVGKDVKKVLEITKDMSVNIDKIAQGMNVVQSLSILNTAMSAVNLGVSIAGFIAVNKKLDKLKNEIEEIHRVVLDVKNIQVLEIFNTGAELVSKTKDLLQHIQDSDCQLKDYENLLGQYRDYLRKMKDYISQGSVSYEKAYKIVMYLLPIYAEILNKYIVESYYAKNRFPEIIYSTHLDTIVTFAEPQFMEQFFDYVFLDCGKTKKIAEEAQEVHVLLVGNAYTQVEDTKGLVLALPDKESYLTLQDLIKKEAHSRVDNLLPA